MIELYPVIWWMFIIAMLITQLGCIMGMFAHLIDWIFKPKFLFFHIVANILWTIGFPLTIILLIPILVDAYIYDFIRPF
ncbi:unnamed protein product [marine sediment metagenome]|uniref:Uncharacterized protein n=1 Tax=marine sediment metagenome TaxID=412755 RepID=X0ZUZ8_9ZZZZ